MATTIADASPLTSLLLHTYARQKITPTGILLGYFRNTELVRVRILFSLYSFFHVGRFFFLLCLLYILKVEVDQLLLFS